MSQVQRVLRTSAVPVAVIAGLLGAWLTWQAFSSSAASPPAPEGKALADAALPAGPPPAEGPRPEAPAGSRPREGNAGDPITGPVLTESRPIRISIPRLGVESDLVNLGVDSSGAMEVPAEAADAGWYELGPTPGALGPAVIAGHVTWNQSPAVFYRLGTLSRGDLVKVTRADGRTAVFSVQGVARYPKAQFPTQKVFGTIDHAGLRLITCGGIYDSAANRYLDNVVVFTALLRVD
jgi:hypothetical protein